MAGEITETNNGIIVGADPKSPLQQGGLWTENQSATGSTAATQSTSIGGYVPTITTGTGTVTTRYYTEEDLDRVRREEKDKLYGRIEDMGQQLRTLTEARETELATVRREAEERAEALRKKEEEEMDLRQLMQRQREELEARLTEVQGAYEQSRAVFETEQRFQQLERYRQERIAQEQEYIMPQLRDLITGNTVEEIDAAIEDMKRRTSDVMSEITASQGQYRQQMRAAAPTAPPVGPLEQLPAQQSLSLDDLRGMDMATYKANRDALLRQASANFYRGG